MIKLPMGFKMDGFNFENYGSALSKVLFSRFPVELSVEVSNVNPPILKNGETGEFLDKYLITFELTQEDFRDLNFIAQGFMPEEDGFIDKLLVMIEEEVAKQRKALTAEQGVPADQHTVLFHGEPVTLQPTAEKEAALMTTFKVVRND